MGACVISYASSVNTMSYRHATGLKERFMRGGQLNASVALPKEEAPTKFNDLEGTPQSGSPGR